MEFYHDLITEKSFKTLQQLKNKYNYILIGDWAIFLYSKTLKSKDIDLIIDYDELDKLRKDFQLFKNERLQKYEIKIEGIDIDIYLPHFSKLGFPIEEIKNYCQSIEGFLAPIPEILLIMKVFTFNERKGTTKGKKDLIDIFGLLKEEKINPVRDYRIKEKTQGKQISNGINWQKYKELIEKYNLEKINQEFKDLISSQTTISELGLLNHQVVKLKKEILKNLLK